MGVTGEISQHLLGPRERLLAVDHPLDAPQWGDEALERSLVGEPGMGVEELQLAGGMRMHEHRQHLALEQARQDVDMDEEVGARGDPSRMIEREPATRPLLRSGALALGAMPITAGIVGNRRVGAVLAARDMAANGC